MAIAERQQANGYSYSDPVVALDETTIEESVERFDYFRSAGVITAGEYHSPAWCLSDEVRRRTICFELDDITAYRCGQELGCSAKQYQQAMRVVVTARFGYSLCTLCNNVAAMVQFAHTRQVPDDYAQALLLYDFLTLLPGNSNRRQDIMRELETRTCMPHRHCRQQRNLACYKSYFRFDLILKDYWKTAPESDKLVFFPVWYWWTVTSILPLRPTETVLTPRHCLSVSGKTYRLTVRRTRLKGTVQAAKYNINDDYELYSFPVPDHIAKEIESYIQATEHCYNSDIDILFCHLSENGYHYTYRNLAQCLWKFYRDVILGKYHMTVPDCECEDLQDDEIMRICLGDTRHIAMISLMLSGGSPSVCRELANHASIVTSAHYFSNISQFLDVLSLHVFRYSGPQVFSLQGELILDQKTPVEGGYCFSPKFRNGEYSDCGMVVSANGEFGDCRACQYFLPGSKSFNMKMPMDEARQHLKEKTMLLRYALESIRNGTGNADTLGIVLDQLRAAEEDYLRKSALSHHLRKENEYE